MPKTLPIVPMRSAVLFPGVSLPITAARPQTLRAIEAAVRDPEHRVLAVAQRTDVDEVLPEGLFTIGTIATISSLERGLGGVRVALEGEERGIVMRVAAKDGYLVATVSEATELPPLSPNDPTFLALHREVRERAAELATRRGLPAEAVGQMLNQIPEAGRLADLVAGYLDAPLADRQGLLEALAVEDRLRRVLIHVQRQIDVLSAQEVIQSKVKEELGERQREVYLREQLRAIQKELGEGDEAADGALAELKAKLDKLPLPDDARREVDREWSRLSRIGRESMESQVIRTYLETIAELPWGARTDEHLDIQKAAKILDEDHYGLRDVKDRVLEFLAVHQLAAGKARKGRILLFAGPPGVGKTSIAKSIARAMGRKYVRISLGGARDEADIRGHRRTYIGALPGRILTGMKQAGSKNPVFLLDEVDKLGVSYQGDPASALLEVLDPAQNDSFIDHYLGVPFDLSEVMFIATANFLQNIPAPLLDRMEVVDFAGYTEAEKLAIAKDYLVPRQLEENGLTAEQLTRHRRRAARGDHRLHPRGRRPPARARARPARPQGRAQDRGARDRARHARPRSDVRPLLGRPRVHPEKAAREDQVGIATGMYYTPAGGDIMFVEASPMRGKGELILTGQLGDVMKESARAAWTFARAHADWLSIDDRVLDRDIHVHVPGRRDPQGRPVGRASRWRPRSCRRCRAGRRSHDVAMTGEITLSGRVLPIGGLKEKVLGAVRAGITHIVIPRDNEADLEDLPAEVRERLTVSPVDTLAEALAITLRDTTLRDGRLSFGDRGPADAARLAH